MHLVRQLDVAAAGCFIAPTARHIADGVAAAAENKHGLAVPKERIVNANRKSTQK